MLKENATLKEKINNGEVKEIEQKLAGTLQGRDEHIYLERLLESAEKGFNQVEAAWGSKVDSEGKLLDRKTGNGILNKTVVETVSDEEVSRVVFTAWDLIDVCDFDKGIDRRTGVERLARLRAIPKLFDVESGTQLCTVRAIIL